MNKKEFRKMRIQRWEDQMGLLSIEELETAKARRRKLIAMLEFGIKAREWEMGFIEKLIREKTPK